MRAENDKTRGDLAGKIKANCDKAIADAIEFENNAEQNTELTFLVEYKYNAEFIELMKRGNHIFM